MPRLLRRLRLFHRPRRFTGCGCCPSHGNVKDAPAAEYWSYDGSVLNSIAEGGSVKFFYVKPSPALKAEGAKFGTIIFEGKLANQKYVGTA